MLDIAPEALVLTATAGRSIGPAMLDVDLTHTSGHLTTSLTLRQIMVLRDLAGEADVRYAR